MDKEILSLLLADLVEKADQISSIEDLLCMLQQLFVEVFLGPKLSDGPKQSSSYSSLQSSQALSVSSDEEVKLSLVRSVRVFHDKGAKSHSMFFEGEAYHPQAALFIHEMLKSLSGNSKQWFRELQVESLSTCVAVLKAIGMKNVRKCLPGIVSATVRYLERCHLGKDSAMVRVRATQVLHTALIISFASKENEEWVIKTIGHLSDAMQPILDPKNLTRNSYGESSVYHLKLLFTDIICSPGMELGQTSTLAENLVVALAVAENIHHLHRGDNENGKRTDSSNRDMSSCLPSRATTEDLMCKLKTNVNVQALSNALSQRGGVELLHILTTLLRFPSLRHIVISSSEDRISVFKAMLRRIIRVVANEIPEDSLYTSRHLRPYPSGVVDEALECLAHALAEIHTQELDDETLGTNLDETIGEFLTNALLEECDAILQDWDLYMIHPPTIYVLTRLVVWQFKPIPEFLSVSFSSSYTDEKGRHVRFFPPPNDFIALGAFEQVWSVVAAPHLWDITEDEDLCNHQQVHHRQVVAATILRFLSVAISDVLKPAILFDEAEGRQSFERFNTLVLYLILEKASATGIVRNTAAECVRQCMDAFGEGNAMIYFSTVCLPLVDAASRAIKQAFLRPSVASVLRGMIEFVLQNSFTVSCRCSHCRSHCMQKGNEVVEHSTNSDTSIYDMMSLMLDGRSSTLSMLVKRRLSVAEVCAIIRHFVFRNEDEISQIADFVRSAVDTAMDGCRIASIGIDRNGLKASLALMRDCLDIAVLLNMRTEREAADDEFERQTTSYNTHVKLLQTKVLEAIMMVISHSAQHTSAFPYVVQVCIRGLTCFLTTAQAESWRRAREQEIEEHEHKTFMNLRDDKKEPCKISKSTGDEENFGNENEESEYATKSSLDAPPLPWLDQNDSSTGETSSLKVKGECLIVLPRTHLKTVYRVYLCFISKLKEPIALFVTAAARPAKRSGEERRRMEAVSVDRAFFAVLEGIEALLLLAVDFLCHRMVNEVLPLILVWYERACLPRIATHTDQRVKEACKRFAQVVMRESPVQSLREEVHKQCTPFFAISLPRVDDSVGDNESNGT